MQVVGSDGMHTSLVARDASEPTGAALELMVPMGHQLPIVQDSLLVDMLSRRDVMRDMHPRDELHLPGSDLSLGTSERRPARSHG